MTVVPVTITTDSMEYQAILDVTLTRAALVTGTIIDDDTGLGIPTAFVHSDRDSAIGRVAAGGFFSISGAIERLFPDLATTAYALTLRIEANRHKPATVIVPVPIAATFPRAAGTVRLRPLPVRIEGRVTRESDRSAIAGATVAVQAPANALLMRTPSYTDHAIANVTPVTMAPGALRSLDEPAPAGALVMKLNNVAGIGGGTILRFGVPPVNEYAAADSADAATSTVTLRYPMGRSYAPTTQVRIMTAAPAGAPVATTRAADAGEALLLLAAPLVSDTVEISDAPPRLEYHDTNLVADAGGFFAADGVAGAASLTLRASSGPFIPLDRELSIDSSRPVAGVSFRLKT